MINKRRRLARPGGEGDHITPVFLRFGDQGRIDDVGSNSGHRIGERLGSGVVLEMRVAADVVRQATLHVRADFARLGDSVERPAKIMH